MGYLHTQQMDATKAMFNVTRYHNQNAKKRISNTARVIAVGGGKGGVGKTFITAATGIILSYLGKDTVIVDGDFGGANLHNCMGIPNPPITSLDFFTRQNLDMNSLLLETSFKNLKILAGPSGAFGSANYRLKLKYNFLTGLRNIVAENIILDLGAGSSFTEIDLFSSADHGFIITTPEPTSIQDSYNFMKLCLYRKLMRHFVDEPRVSKLLTSSMNPFEYRKICTIGKLIQKTKSVDPILGYRFENVVAGFRPKLIMNMVETQTDCEEGIALQIAMRENLNVSLRYSGFIPYNENVRKAFRNMQPKLLTPDKDDGLRQNLTEIVKQSILNSNGHYHSPKFDYLPRAKTVNSYFPADPYENEIICSVKCSLWGQCSAQNGGYPCRVKYIGYAHQHD